MCNPWQVLRTRYSIVKGSPREWVMTFQEGESEIPNGVQPSFLQPRVRVDFLEGINFEGLGGK